MKIKALNWTTIDYTFASSLNMEFSIFKEEGKFWMRPKGLPYPFNTKMEYFILPGCATLDAAKAQAQEIFEKVVNTVLEN